MPLARRMLIRDQFTLKLVRVVCLYSMVCCLEVSMMMIVNTNLPSRTNVKSSKPTESKSSYGHQHGSGYGSFGQHRSFTHDQTVDYSHEQTNDERRLFSYLMRNYDNTVRPVQNASTPIHIRLGITLTQIFDLDEKNQVLTTNVWLDQEWIDEFLTWNTSQFGNISKIRIPCQSIWLPDIVLYNNADDYTRGYMNSRAIIESNGNVFWPPPTKFRSTCSVDVTYFPFDDQNCTMKFGSWIYDGLQVNIENRTQNVDLSNYVANGEWDLIGTTLVRNVVFYPCCFEPFPDVTVTVVIRRKILYYMYNVILPCIMMSVLTLLVFCLPPESGEKIALGVTVLLAFSVFMLAISEKLPETSESIPLLGVYLTVVMSITSVSIVMTVVVLNFHYCTPLNKRELPGWIRKVIDSEATLDRYFDLHHQHRHQCDHCRHVNTVPATSAKWNHTSGTRANQAWYKHDDNQPHQIWPINDPVLANSTSIPTTTKLRNSNRIGTTRQPIENCLHIPPTSTPTTKFPKVMNAKVVDAHESKLYSCATVSDAPSVAEALYQYGSPMFHYNGQNTSGITVAANIMPCALTAAAAASRLSAHNRMATADSWSDIANIHRTKFSHQQVKSNGGELRSNPAIIDDDDRMEFATNETYDPREQLLHPPKKSPSTSNLSQTDQEILSMLRNLQRRQDFEDSCNRRVYEWRLLSMFIDRILFWIFTVTTVITSVIFLFIIPFQRRGWWYNSIG